MTSPDGYTPNGAYGAGDVASLQYVTQESMAQQVNAGLQQSLDENVGDRMPNFIQLLIAGALFALGDLVGGIPLVGDTLEAAIDGVANTILPIKTTANTANTTANTANTTANTAYTLAGSAHTAALTAEGTAAEANTTAEAAANDAAQAAIDAAAAAADAFEAYGLASYWEAECVVASADVLLGVNELLIGLCQNVPAGQTRSITNIHFAFSAKTGTMTIETKKWNAAGTSSSVIHTATIGAGVTRVNYPVNISVADKERVFWNVTASSATATVLQCLLFGVIQ